MHATSQRSLCVGVCLALRVGILTLSGLLVLVLILVLVLVLVLLLLVLLIHGIICAGLRSLLVLHVVLRLARRLVLFVEHLIVHVRRLGVCLLPRT